MKVSFEWTFEDSCFNIYRNPEGLFTAHELNWAATSRPSYTTRQDAFIGHARQSHDVIGCSETRSVGAQRVLYVSLQQLFTPTFANRVYFSPIKFI